jgi:cytochrome c553
MGIEVPPLDDEGMIRLGAAHFESGCAGCHGAPGRPASAFARSMLPQPPPLSTTVSDWATEELFWIVQNGQKYTGMPAWTALEREDEIWAVTAFLLRLPALDRAQYERLAGIADGATPQEPFAAEDPRLAALLTDCARCHGADGAHPVARAVPILLGQQVSYFARALREYRSGARRSGIMQPVATSLEDEEIAALARYFAGPGLATPPPNAPAPADVAARGERIVTAGLPEQDVPACIACHGQSRDRGVPRLTGQHSTYLAQQLRLLRAGLRRGSAHARLMAPIAARLTDAQILDAAAWLESAGPRPPMASP